MVLSEYFSDDMSKRAEVLLEREDFVVKMYKDDKLVKAHAIVGHTLQYAEDCAENWTLGVIKE